MNFRCPPEHAVFFPSCWTEGNGSELKRNWVPAAEKWTRTNRGIRKEGRGFIPWTSMCLRLAWGRALVWSEPTNVERISSFSHAGALNIGSFGSAWDAGWFSTWSPRGSESDSDTPLSRAQHFKRVQLHRINSHLFENFRAEHMQRHNTVFKDTFGGD